MKRIILSLVALMSILIFSCKKDYVLPQINTTTTQNIAREPLVSLNFRGVSNISKSRGFTINANHTNGRNFGSIAFSTGSWSTTPPNVILVVKDASNNVLWAKQLDSQKPEYEYVAGESPEVHFNTDIKYVANDVDSQKLFIYMFDSELKSTCKLSSDRYEVKINFPSPKYDSEDHFYSINPANKENQKLIFSASVPMKTIVDNATQNKRTMIGEAKPLGTLILLSLRNISEESYEVNNGYLLRFKTNGLSFEGTEINCANEEVTHSSRYIYNTNSDSRDVYKADDNGNIDYTNLNSSSQLDYIDIRLMNPSGSSVTLASGEASSIVYALYLMPTSNSNSKSDMLQVFHPYNDNGKSRLAYLLYPDKLFNFYDSNHKSLSLTLGIPNKDVAANIKYNALAYVGKYNIANNETSLNKTNASNNNALVTQESAKTLFTENTNGFLNGSHLPSIFEWKSILPYDIYLVKFIESVNRNYTQYHDPGKSVQIGKAEFSNETSHYKTIQENSKYVTYAIRFIYGTLIKNEKGEDANIKYSSDNSRYTPYMSLWRYSYVDNPEGGKMMDIYCYVLPYGTHVEFDNDNLTYDHGKEFMTEEFFKGKIGHGCTHRVLPSTGYGDGPNNYTNTNNTQGFYWSASLLNNIYYDMYFDHNSGFSDGNSSVNSSSKFAVRPFLNTPEK